MFSYISYVFLVELIIHPLAVAQIRSAADGATVRKSCWAFISLEEEFFSGNLLSGKCRPIVMA